MWDGSPIKHAVRQNRREEVHHINQRYDGLPPTDYA